MSSRRGAKYGLSRILDDDGPFSTRTDREIRGDRHNFVLLEGLDHRKCRSVEI